MLSQHICQKDLLSEEYNIDDHYANKDIQDQQQGKEASFDDEAEAQYKDRYAVQGQEYDNEQEHDTSRWL